MRKKSIFFAVVVLCVAIAAIGFYLYQKPRVSLTGVKPAYTLGAADLYKAFQQNEKKANEQFIDKVIQVKGTVENVQPTDSTISLLLSAGDEMGGINCTLAKTNNKEEKIPAKGGFIQVKGRCIGFLMDVNLVDAVIEE